MALEKKIIGLPIAKGTNEKISDRVLPLGELSEAKNVQFAKGGEAKKRKGFHSLSNDIPAIVASDAARTINNGKAVASYNDEILAFDGRYGYTKTSTDDDWVNKGTIVGCTLENELVEAGTNLVQTSAHIAQSNNFEVHVWSEVDPTEVVSITDDFASVTPAVLATPSSATQTSGSGLSDLTPGGWYTGTVARTYKIVCTDQASSPDQFQWLYDDNSDGSFVSGGTGVNFATSAIALNDGVTIQMGAVDGHTRDDTWTFTVSAGSPDLRLNTMPDHNFSVGQKLTTNFTDSSWPDGDYVVTSVDSTSAIRITLGANVPINPSVDATGGTVTNFGGAGVVWRTYAKVLDKTTRTEVVAKTLVNVFTTGNSIYNIPRAQVAASGQHVFIFVHVGSGRIKYTKVDTGSGTGAIANALNPGVLTNSASDVLFSVDQTNPDWCVEAVNNASITNGICVLARRSGAEGFRLSYFNNSGGTLSEEGSSPAPVTDSTVIHYPPAELAAVGITSETYTTNKTQFEIVGGLMLKVVTPSDSITGDYIAVGYTSSDDMTAADLNRGGTADEPNGIRLRVYNAALALQGSEQEVQIDAASTEFASTGEPGFVLVNGTAGKNAAGKVRFFLTMVANKTNLSGRSPKFLVNAYDYTLTGGIADIDLDLYGITITSDCFAHNRDLYLGVGYASRTNLTGGSAPLSRFNTSVGMIMNHQGEVVAKGATSAGPWVQEIDFRFMQYADFNRIHAMYGVQRVVVENSSEVLTGSIDPAASTTVPGVGTKFTTELTVGDLITVSGETRQVTAIASDTSLTVGTAFSNNANDTSPEKYVATKYKFGSSRYSGVNLNSSGLELTAMDAAVGTMDFSPVRYLPSVQANGALKVAGGILWDYSGDYFKEDNFFYYPEIHSTDLSVSGVLNGTYYYKAIYEWIDHNGKIQRSNPSLPYTAVVSSKKVTLGIYNLHLTHKKDATTTLNPGGFAAVNWGARSEVKLVLYRTKTTGSVFHRCAEVLMDYSDRYQSITDNLADSNLEDNPVLYTTGGNAGHICPPSQYDIALWKDRVFLATTENTVWFSKRFAENRETGFNDEAFVRSVDNRSERIRALCPNLEHLLILGARNGYYMSGDGPSDSGAGPGFSPLRVFAPGQGAIDGTCRVETPVGVFFQTPQGLMLCARNMQVTHKGAKVEDQVTATNYAIDGHVFDTDHEVRFTVEGGQKIAVYNYLFDQWSTWDLHTDTGLNAASAVVGGAHYRLNHLGVLYQQQTAETYHDSVGGSNKSYNMQLTSGWINIGQLQQVGRVYRLLMLGDFNTSSLPYFVIYTDYSTSGTQVTYPTSGPGTSKFQLELKLPKQKVKSLKFKLSESTPLAGGGYMAIQSIAMLVGIKKPGTSFKLPTADHMTNVV